MFEIKKLKGNTYYYEAYTNVGIYVPDGKNALLIDACDHPRMVKGLDRQLCEAGISVGCIIDTHCHIDHICGNSYFKNKYGCRLLCTEKEKPFICYPSLESEFYYAGINTDKSKNPLFLVEPTVPEIINESNIPEGLELVSLPGHGFEMIGVKTPDNVFFVADAVLSVKTWEEYRLPFFREVNKAVETLEMLRGISADIYVPSHNPPLDSITELAEYNIERLREKKALIYSLCNGSSFEELFEETLHREALQIRTEKYPMYAVMVRNFLQALVEDDKIYAVYENNRMVYYGK